MPQLDSEALTTYLQSLYRNHVQVVSMTTQEPVSDSDILKGFGYGSPVFLEYEVAGKRQKAVLETMAPSSFGHDHFSDRAQTILWEHAAFNALPRHCRSVDSGAFLDSGDLLSTGKTREFFLLTEFVQGDGYYKDLERIKESGVLQEQDIARVLALSDYLADIHQAKKASTELYVRRIRDLLGHGECIMGVIDNYPEKFDFIDQQLLQSIETKCLAWRWKLKKRTQRLCQVHGDFHPWNILFRDATDFTVLDRSRGEWGEAADDIACMTVNYLFISIVKTGKLEGAFEKMFHAFWDNYLTKTNDHEMLEVIAPFYAWRGLVIASPIWYPKLENEVREKIFRFILNVLDAERFEPSAIQRYLD